VVSTGSIDGPGSSDAPGAIEGPGPADAPAPTDAQGASEGPGPAPADEPGQGGAAARVEQPGRYQRSPAGMVGALIVTLLVISAFVAFRAFNRTDLDVKPERVDYLSQVRFAQQDAARSGADLVYPARLPSGWYATDITFSPDGTRPEVRLSMLTAGNQYVGFVQSPLSLPVLLATYVDPHPQAGPSVTVPRAIVPRWNTWTDAGGDTALAAQHGHESLLVFGTVSQAQLEQLAASLTTAPVAG
jgi:hypothetical protein